MQSKVFHFCEANQDLVNDVENWQRNHILCSIYVDFAQRSHAVKEGHENQDSIFFFSHVSLLCLPRAFFRLVEKRKKITPVLQSNQELTVPICEWFRPHASNYPFAAPSFRFVCSGSIWVPVSNPLSVKKFNETSTFKEGRQTVNSSLRVLSRGSSGDKPLALKMKNTFTFRLEN